MTSTTASLHVAFGLTGYYGLAQADDPALLPFTQLCDVETLGPLLDRASTLCGGCATPAAEAAAGGLFVGDAASVLAAAFAGTLLAERRGVDLEAGTLSLRMGQEGFDGLATMVEPRMLTLPGDPLPGGVPVADLDALRAFVAARYVTLLAPVIDSVAKLRRRGLRALWTDAADRFVNAMLSSSRALPGVDVRDEVERLLAVAPARLRHEVDWLEVTSRAGRSLWKRRKVCCLAYQTPRWLGQACSTCPRVTVDETVRRIAEHLDTQPA